MKLVDSNGLRSDRPFFLEEGYEARTEREMAAPLAPVMYVWTSEDPCVQQIKKVLSALFFPHALYMMGHSLVGRLVVPASIPSLLGMSGSSASVATLFRRLLAVGGGEWKYKRLTIQVDGKNIDAYLVCRQETFRNRRWVLWSSGNGEFAETLLLEGTAQRLLQEVGANGLLFNYPAVGASGRPVKKESMIKAYRALLHFVHDREKGLGAEELIAYGHSIGGAVQALAIDEEKRLLSSMRFVAIKSRTFSSLTSLMESCPLCILGCFLRTMGWEMDVASCSKKLEYPEIVLQTANVASPQVVGNQSSVRFIDDDVVPAHATLARSIQRSSPSHTCLIAIPERHNEDLGSETLHLVGQKVAELLSTRK